MAPTRRLKPDVMVLEPPMQIRRSITEYAALGLILATHLGAQLPKERTDVGIVRFPNSGSTAAQAPFLRGIAQLHNFEYREAAQAFQQAEKADPKFALPYWFEALTHSPILWSIDDPPAARAVLARLAPSSSKRLAKSATPRERAFGAAIEAFYADTTLTVRTKAFADSLSALAQRDTTDLEASAFAALGNLMFATQRDIPQAAHDANSLRAIAFAERVSRLSPRHPGATHYLIHASDTFNAYTPRALQPAFVYAYIAPAAEHAQHMPAHVFLKDGLWHDMVASTEDAWKSSVAEAAREHRAPTELDYHNFVWLQYAYLQAGRWHAARALIDSARKMITPYDTGPTFTIDAHYAVPFLEFGYANETDRWADGPSGAPATAMLGPAAERQRERQQMTSTNFERIAAGLMRADSRVVPAANAYADSTLRGQELRAVMAERLGDREQALEWWRRAAALDTSIIGGPPRSLVAHERLGALLLSMGRANEAVAEYERSIKSGPGRSTALLGLARARLAAGDTAGSAVAYARLLDNWSHGDADLPALAEARRGATRGKPSTVANTDAAITKQRVWFKNGPLMLEGFLFKPAGAGPFPTVVWNHGSEPNPGAGKQFDGIADMFVPHGYVVFSPVRRGHDESEGEYIAVARGRVAGSHGQQAGDALVARLLPTEQLSDQLAGLSYLKALPFVDTTRMVVAGCSFGGIMALLGAEGTHGFRASLPISPAAQNWDHNAPLKARLIAGVSDIRIPVFLIQPPRDASLGPVRDLGAEFTRLKKDYRGKVWPDTLKGREAGHCFGGDSGNRVWAGEAVAFFDSVLAKKR
jgi:dienelactone hydrolase/tetratricopeptide (TPR) repeat protein